MHFNILFITKFWFTFPFSMLFFGGGFECFAFVTNNEWVQIKDDRQNTITEVGQIQSSRCCGGLICKAFCFPAFKSMWLKFRMCVQQIRTLSQQILDNIIDWFQSYFGHKLTHNKLKCVLCLQIGSFSELFQLSQLNTFLLIIFITFAAISIFLRKPQCVIQCSALREIPTIYEK